MTRSPPRNPPTPVDGDPPMDVPPTTEPSEEARRRALLVMLEDLEADRRKIEQARREWLQVVDVIADPIFVHDRDHRIVRANRAYAEAAGMDVRDVIGKRYWELFPKGSGPLPGCARALQSEKAEEEEVQTESGRVYQSHAYALRDTENRYLYSLHVLRDITTRKRAEEALRNSRDLITSIVEHAPIRIFWKDRNSRFLGCNTAFARDAGLTHPQDLIGKDDFQMVWRDQAERYRADDRQVMESGIPKLSFEEPQTAPDGRTIWLRTSKVPLRDAGGEISGILGIYEDITARRQMELALHRSNRALRTLSACNEALVRATDEEALLRDMCRVIVEVGGYRLAWVGWVEHDAAKSVRPVAHAGYDAGYFETTQLTWADTEHGRGPMGIAIRTGMPQAACDIHSDPRYAPWRAQALKHGYASGLALPLKEEDGEVFAVLNVYAAEPDAFDQEEIGLLQELAEDLAFGLLTLRTRNERDRLQEEHAKSGERFKATLTDTIRAIARTIEKRDPYTAGHQQRVAELCVAIGGELGLDPDRLQGLRLGATIHDIGKIYVPAEILNRPGRLTKVEFEMIQTHPEVGYDIIKDVKFPWPVGEMILQHHERLDGSGYPKALKGDAIALEARILAVADTVEAMYSHRPYRPAHGLDAALAEIAAHRGTRYDAVVVEACLRLFKEKGFTLERP